MLVSGERPRERVQEVGAVRVTREAPLACLRDQTIAGRFHAWRGRSGQRYLTTVYPVDHADPAACLPDLGPAVLLSVTHRDSRRAIVSGRVVERGSDWADAAMRLHASADEWHVHLLASDRGARAAALADIREVPRLACVA